MRLERIRVTVQTASGQLVEHKGWQEWKPKPKSCMLHRVSRSGKNPRPLPK